MLENGQIFCYAQRDDLSACPTTLLWQEKDGSSDNSLTII
jgi:hypothetical protein